MTYRHCLATDASSPAPTPSTAVHEPTLEPTATAGSTPGPELRLLPAPQPTLEPTPALQLTLEPTPAAIANSTTEQQSSGGGKGKKQHWSKSFSWSAGTWQRPGQNFSSFLTDDARGRPNSHPSATWQRPGQNFSTFLTDDALVHHLSVRSTNEHEIWTCRLICKLMCTKFTSNGRLCFKTKEIGRFGLSLGMKLGVTERMLKMKLRMLP